MTGIKASEGCPANPAWQGLAGAEEGQEKLLESCFSNWSVRVEWRFDRLLIRIVLCASKSGARWIMSILAWPGMSCVPSGFALGPDLPCHGEMRRLEARVCRLVCPTGP